MEEPWLRGPIEGVSPLLAPLLRSFEMAREDVRKALEGLSREQLWARPSGVAPVGFHVRHIGHSVDRLVTYADGRQLSAEQMAVLKRELEPGASAEDLLREMEALLGKAEEIARGWDPATYGDPRTVGRKQLPTTVIGLIVHTAEHTQRHTGQAITTARIIRATS